MNITDVFPTLPRVHRLLACRPQVDEPVDFWIWLRSLQGLVNRDDAHLYLVRGAGALGSDPRTPLYEEHWLDYYREAFAIPVEELNDVDALIDRYRDAFDGYVVYDTSEVIQTQNLAITLCGLDGTLPIAPDQEKWMTRHGIPRRDDLRGRFRNDLAAAEWAIDNLWPRCYRRLYANLCVHRPSWYALAHELEDFIVCHRGMALDLPLSRQTRRSLALYRRMLEEAERPGVQMNWHCVLDQEKEYVAESAKQGFCNLCSVGSPNLTVHGGIGDPDASYDQPLPSAETCTAEKGKVYVCLYNSDGDATWAMNNLHSGNWLAPQRGSFPFGWGFLPLMVKLMPGMLRYYWETKHENDCFWGPSSGAAYTYSHLWPGELVEWYLNESRRLLDQTGQNGCNMVNWFLQDWWREVEDTPAVRREQEAMKRGPGLVCGLGGSPYAQSYLDGPIPKLHSVHIANVGRDNAGDIIRFARECPTRPLFMFLFAQIAEGIWEQLDSEIDRLAGAGIELVGMDTFFLTLQDAIRRDLVSDELYEKTDALSETWLRAPGRNRLPYCAKLAQELAVAAADDPERRRAVLSRAGWIDLVSREIEHAARDRDSFMTAYQWRSPVEPDDEADTLLYVTFTVAWTVVRSVLESRGIYANDRFSAIDAFRSIAADTVATDPFDRIFAAWDDWEAGPPRVDEIAVWCGALAEAADRLCRRFGPDTDEEFEGWLPKPI